MALFFNAKALKSARSSGFKSTSNAIAELIDNSFDANANAVKVIFVEMLDENGRSSVQEIIVADDGEGMSKEILQDCLTFGGTGNDDLEEIVANKKLGKFGFGLPNSSLSQSPHTDVYSWQKSGKPYNTSLDLNKALTENSIDVPEPRQDDLPETFKKLKAVISKKQGTIIHWKNCDRLSHKRADTLIRHAEELLGRVFRYQILDGRQILFEAYQRNRRQNSFSSLIASRPAVVNDPLFLTEECVVAKDVYRQANEHSNDNVRKYTEQFAISETKCKLTNSRLDEHCFEYFFKWQGKKYKFEFVTSVAHKDIQKPGVREGGNTPVGRAYGRKEELGSICFVRSRREISSGRYGIYKATDARQRWWTIEVRFLPDSDDLLGVANNKQDIAFKTTTRDQQDEEYNEYEAGLLEARTELWICLTKQLSDIQKEALKAVKNDEKQFKLETATDPTVEPLPGQTQATTSATIITDGQRPTQFSEDEKKQLFEKLSTKFPNIDANAIYNAIEKYDQYKVRGVLLYAPNPGVEQLWSLTPVAGFLIILVNSEHEFFTNVLEPMRDANKKHALSALELFISSLAWDEYKHFWDNEDKKDLLEDYRSYVGLHLRRYLRENKIVLDEGDFTDAGDDE